MKFLLYFLLGFLSTVNIYGQENYAQLVDILPPSPNAAALGKFGGINPSLSTGAMSHSISLYTYESRNLKFPIILNYYSDGVKVDEIASRMGTSWSLSTGGIITRTVRGKNDLNSTRIAPPPTYPEVKDRKLLDFFESVSTTIENGGNSDAEPDLFSFNFNGYTGQFILDSSMTTPILLQNSNLKIEFSISQEFKITDGDGVEYYFGEGNAKESSNRLSGTSCGKAYYDPTITAWNISRIIHPNRDTIWFSYDHIGYFYKNSISESAYANIVVPGEEGIQCDAYYLKRPQMQNKFCESYLQVSTSLLKNITSSAGPSVRFTYISRIDIPNDKLYDSIIVNNIFTGKDLKTFKFSYENAVPSQRPFLTGITESSKGVNSQYFFSYLDINSLPPLLSFAKDHYGYFNGKNNTTLLPLPEDLLWRKMLPGANADRNPDENFAVKGMLNKIQYPTGGSDSIVYEGNRRYTLVDILPPITNISKSAYSAQWPGETSVSENFVISFNQQTELNAVCTFGGLPEEQDSLHNKGIVSIRNTITNVEIYSKQLLAGETLNEIITLLSGSYSLTFTAMGSKVTMGGTLACRIGNKTQQNMNEMYSGVRVAKFISKNNFGVQEIHKFLYAKLDSPDVSSFSSEIWKPQYESILRLYQTCGTGTLKDPENPATMLDCGVGFFDYYSSSSNTLNNIYLYSSPVAYSSVIESYGENYENGGIEHQFIVRSNFPGGSTLGNFIIGAPMIDNGWINGKETYTQYFKKIGSAFKPIKKVYTHYKDDASFKNSYNTKPGFSPVLDSVYKCYTINKKYSPFCVKEPPSSTEIEAWDCQEYWYYVKWMYIDTVRTQIFAPDGLSYLEEISITGYSNPKHALPTSFIFIKSNNLFKTELRYYPTDLTLTGTSEIARQNLVAKHILNPFLLRSTFDNNALVEITNNYLIQPNGLNLPKEIYVKIKNNPPEKRVDFGKYNQYGKLLQQNKQNDVKEVYFWGYKSLYPVAKILNTTYDTASVFIDQTILDSPANDEVLRTELNKLRINLPNAIVTTFTYMPEVGMTSSTDPNGKTTYYEYDNFNRLSLIRDQEKNVVKKFCYNYAGQPESCDYTPPVIYQNQTQSQSFIRNNCTSNETGSSVTYTVNEGTYQSTISPADANNQALADIALNGQAYANQNGTCTATTIYARVELSNYYYDVSSTTADVWIKFYSDVQCTIPLSVSNLTVSYQGVKQVCGGNAYTYLYSINCTGSQVFAGNYVIDRDDGIHCDNTVYSVTPGSGYVAQ